MNQLKRIFFCILFFFFHTILFANSEPQVMLSQTADEMIAAFKAAKGVLKTKPQYVQEVVRRYLLPHVDVNGMSRSVLGGEIWRRISKEEQQAFSRAFTKLVIRTYASSFSEYTDETIRFQPKSIANNEKFTRVESLIIRTNGQNIPVRYSLVRLGNQWKIYDFSIEGVSLLQSYRQQFQSALRTSSMAALILRMEKSNAVN